MRLRLQFFLPLAVGVVVAAGFVLAAGSVGNAVRQALLTVPGLTRDRAVEAAVAAVALAGIVVTVAAVVLSALLTRMVVGPLRRMQRAAGRFTESASPVEVATPIAEIQDVGRSFNTVADELRDRHDWERQERSDLMALLDAVSEGILQVDPAGKIARVNPGGRTLLGLPEDAVGRPIQSLLRDGELRRAMERGVKGETTAAAEVVLDERRVLVSVAPQEAGGAVATLVDLTDLRRLEEVRRDFVANASHELKTPLTSIRGYTDTLLGSDLPDAERRQFLGTISRNAERLQRIVDDLLDLSRLEAGRWRPDLDTIPVLEVAERVWRSFGDRAIDRSVAFEVAADGDDRALVDRHALEQIFTNLLDNAIRHTPGGLVRVTTRIDADGPAEHDPQEGNERWLVVEVADTGAGIPRDVLPRIFERFYRVDPARSRAEGGTGLGLSIVKHMVESMGGAIRAESELGKGTVVRIWLRRRAP